MPEYQYSALSRQGVEVSGSEQADSVEALTRQLKKQQITLLNARERKKKAIPFGVIQAFLAELSPLVNNGIPIDRALQIVGEDSSDPKIGDLAAQLRKGIKRGESLSQALVQSGRFDTLLVALVKVGETSGELARVLTILETYYQEARQTRRDLIAALSYPAILALVSLLSIIGLALFVVPVFRDIFDEKAQEALPLGTKVLFAGSEFLIHYGAALALGLIGLGIGVSLLVQRHDGANRLWHHFLLDAPLIGQIRSRFEGFKLAKALSIMMERGVPLIQAAEIAQPLLANRIQREGFAACAQALRKGEPIPQAIARIPGLPVQFHRYIKLGNETGTLGQNLGKAADLLLDDFKNRLRSLIAILDPLIIITMGGIVAFMVISILLAVFSLSDVR
ncbi:MAG: type II secretion system F family protein [Sterolibacterium sp.]|jgi:general secretion pathway protein F